MAPAPVIHDRGCFGHVKDRVKADKSGNVALGAEYSEGYFLVAVSEDGVLTLRPISEREMLLFYGPDALAAAQQRTESVTDKEKWLYHNPEAMARVQEGLDAAAAGKFGKELNYSQYADDNIENE